jgi:hypothetical protein
MYTSKANSKAGVPSREFLMSGMDDAARIIQAREGITYEAAYAKVLEENPDWYRDFKEAHARVAFRKAAGLD